MADALVDLDSVADRHAFQECDALEIAENVPRRHHDQWTQMKLGREAGFIPHHGERLHPEFIEANQRQPPTPVLHHDFEGGSRPLPRDRVGVTACKVSSKLTGPGSRVGAACNARRQTGRTRQEPHRRESERRPPPPAHDLSAGSGVAGKSFSSSSVPKT